MEGENKRPEHKTPQMHMNDHEEKFRSALGDMQAIQANDPLKRLISSALGPITAAREKIRELLDRAGVAHQAPGAKKITSKLDAVADKADEAYRHAVDGLQAGSRVAHTWWTIIVGDTCGNDATAGSVRRVSNAALARHFARARYTAN